MSNISPKKTAAQLAWRRLRDRDIAAAISDRKRRAAHNVITQPPELQPKCVSSTNTTPDSAHDKESHAHER